MKDFYFYELHKNGSKVDTFIKLDARLNQGWKLGEGEYLVVFKPDQKTPSYLLVTNEEIEHFRSDQTQIESKQQETKWSATKEIWNPFAELEELSKTMKPNLNGFHLLSESLKRIKEKLSEAPIFNINGKPYKMLSFESLNKRLKPNFKVGEVSETVFDGKALSFNLGDLAPGESKTIDLQSANKSTFEFDNNVNVKVDDKTTLDSIKGGTGGGSGPYSRNKSKLGQTKDHINPSHYQSFFGGNGLEELQWLEAKQYEGQFKDPVKFKAAVSLQIEKYLDRNGGKDKEDQELSKALWYLKFLVAYIKNDNAPIRVVDIDKILKG